MLPVFDHYIGIDYSGAQTPTASLEGLRVYMAEGDAPPIGVPSIADPSWIVAKLDELMALFYANYARKGWHHVGE